MLRNLLRSGASLLRNSSHKLSLRAQPVPGVTYSVKELSDNKWLFPEPTGTQSEHTHKSDAQKNINKMPVILVDGNTARCVGGSMGLGHPQVYLQLNRKKANEPATCNYCGLRYMKNPESHH